MCGETKTVPAYEPEIYKFRNGRGDAVITSYNVFPGIELAFYSVHMDSFFWGEGGKRGFHGNMPLQERAHGAGAGKWKRLYHAGGSVRYN